MTKDKGIVLILGAKGNLGTQLVEVFSQDNNYKVIAWDRGEIDITDKDLILKKIQDIKPNIIVNTAAYNSVDKCEDDDEYEKAKNLNIDGPKYLAEAALKVGALLVHYSTDYVFDGEKEDGYTEDDKPCPINRYGKTKFFGEKKILENSGSGLKWYIIRTSKLFGPKPENENNKPSFFDIILNSSNQKELGVVDDEKSCFTYTPDLAQATKKLIESDKGYGIYHLVNSSPCTWHKGAKEFFAQKGIDIKLKPIQPDKLGRLAKRPKCSVLLNTKFTPLRDWKEALREYVKSE